MRSEKNEDKRAKLVAERKKLQGQRPAMRKHAREQFDKIGISRAQLDRLNAIPKGELRRERYNHAVMLEAPALSPKQTALVRACIAATDSVVAQHPDVPWLRYWSDRYFRNCLVLGQALALLPGIQ